MKGLKGNMIIDKVFKDETLEEILGILVSLFFVFLIFGVPLFMILYLLGVI